MVSNPQTRPPQPAQLVIFFNDTATTEIYTLSLHDALPISSSSIPDISSPAIAAAGRFVSFACWRSEEHTSALQSHHDLVCRLLLEKYKPQLIIKESSQLNARLYISHLRTHTW